MDHLPRRVEVQQGRAHAVDEAIAVGQHAMIEQQPSLSRLDRDGARADFGVLPRPRLGDHYPSMLSPMDHIRDFTVEDVAKRGVIVSRFLDSSAFYVIRSRWV